MTYYEIWQMEKYGNALPETECSEAEEIEVKEIPLKENIISQN